MTFARHRYRHDAAARKLLCLTERVTYQELSGLTSEMERDVYFELSAETAEVLKTLPGFEEFGHK